MVVAKGWLLRATMDADTNFLDQTGRDGRELDDLFNAFQFNTTEFMLILN